MVGHVQRNMDHSSQQQQNVTTAEEKGIELRSVKGQKRSQQNTWKGKRPEATFFVKSLS